MRKVFVFFLIIINLGLLYVAYLLLTPLISPGNATLTIDTKEVSATVSLNGKTVGKTFFENKNLKAGEYLVSLSAELGEATGSATPSATTKVTWESKVKLTANTQTVVNRSFGPSEIFSAGEVLTLEKGSGLSIVSNPEGAAVTIDGKDTGETPLALEERETRTIKLNKKGYFGRELTVKIPTGYRLTIVSNLAINPLSPLTEKETRDKVKLIDLATDNAALLANPKDWAAGVFYFDQKFASSSADLDLLLDSRGATHSATPKRWEAKVKDKKEARVGYLGKTGENLPEEAKKAWDSLIAAFTGGASSSSGSGQIEVTATPTGFLRVRQTPSTGGVEITRVSPGEKFALLEERSGWYKIKLSDGKEGWVSAQYAKKL